jgi:peptidoglycan/LPS O-acetylase OafA/YrhL
MGLPHALQEPTTLSAQLIVLIALAGALAGIARRLRFRLGPWWLWAIPVLAIAATVPVVGTPRYRAPADPFLLLLVAAVLAAVGDRVARRARSPQRPRPPEPNPT